VSRAALIVAWCVWHAGAGGVRAHAAPRTVEYLHVEANTGGSSGGHAALCVATECFHFQQGDEGLLRLVKDRAEHFDHVYRALENRTIHAYRLSLADDAVARLAHALASAHLVQDRQVAVREALREEGAFLDVLRARHRAADGAAHALASERRRQRAGGIGARIPEIPIPTGRTPSARTPGAQLPTGRIATARMRRPRASHVRTSRRAPSPLVRVPGSGYFVLAPAKTGAGDSSGGRPQPSPAIAELVSRLAETYGVDGLARRERELRREISGLGPPAISSPLAPPSLERLPAPWHGMAARYRELIGGWVATDVLARRTGLRRDRVWGLAAPDVDGAPTGGAAVVDATPGLAIPDAATRDYSPLVLASHEIEALRVYRRASIAALVRLFGGRRPDWGYPMLVGIARLAALDASIAARRLVLLDVFREDAPIIPPAAVGQHRDALTALAEERRAELGAARAVFFASDGGDEMAWSHLEAAGNLWLEMTRALAGKGPLRVHHDEPVPAASATGAGWPRPHPADAEIVRARVAIEERERVYDRALRALYPYDVMRSNCVTAIFRALEQALGADGDPPTPSGHGAADGRLALGGPLDFVPFMSARSVARALGARAVERPSYRRVALARLGAQDPRRPLWWREANVLSSRIYRRHGADAPFLFFTEDTAPLRPLFGVVNLVVGAGATAAGVALVPFDGGATARRGASAVLASVPELAFVGIRKGTFPFMPRSWLDACPDDAPAATRIPNAGARDGAGGGRTPAPLSCDVGRTAHGAADVGVPQEAA
jgi:hypothetical protein